MTDWPYRLSWDEIAQSMMGYALVLIAMFVKWIMYNESNSRQKI